MLPFTRCEKIARLADYRVPDVYSRCKIIRRFFSGAYDPQRRLIGSHGRLFCSNLRGSRFPHIFAGNRAKDAFLRGATQAKTMRKETGRIPGRTRARRSTGSEFQGVRVSLSSYAVERRPTRDRCRFLRRSITILDSLRIDIFLDVPS